MALQDYSLKQREAAPDPLAFLDGLDEAALMQLRNAIDKKLDLDPRSLNMAEELGFQYKAGRALLASITDDKDVPANQRAQVLNSLGAMLKDLSKNMGAAYSAERLKRYEAAVMKTLEVFDEAAKLRFMDLYSDYINKDGSFK